MQIPVGGFAARDKRTTPLEPEGFFFLIPCIISTSLSAFFSSTLQPSIRGLPRLAWPENDPHILQTRTHIASPSTSLVPSRDRLGGRVFVQREGVFERVQARCSLSIRPTIPVPSQASSFAAALVGPFLTLRGPDLPENETALAPPTSHGCLVCVAPVCWGLFLSRTRLLPAAFIYYRRSRGNSCSASSELPYP